MPNRVEFGIVIPVGRAPPTGWFGPKLKGGPCPPYRKLRTELDVGWAPPTDAICYLLSMLAVEKWPCDYSVQRTTFRTFSQNVLL